MLRNSAFAIEIRKVIVGQDDVVEHLLLTLLVGGHCLITGMPGTAKTLLVRTLATALGLTFKRIQFTPDLMPTDVTGTDIIDEDITTGHRKWTFVEGPIFTNVMLGRRDQPYASEDPGGAAGSHAGIERDGSRHDVSSYRRRSSCSRRRTRSSWRGPIPLPEAQLDRFLFNVVLDYLSAEQEMDVVNRNTTGVLAEVEACTSVEEILQFQQLVRQVPVAEDVVRYAVNLVRAHPSQRFRKLPRW